MQEVFAQIRRYLDAHRGEMLALWEELVNLESGSRQLVELQALCDRLRRALEEAGAVTRTVLMPDAGSVLIGEWNAGAPGAPLVFLGHMDTVFPAGEAKARPFRIDETGRAWGPGVLDMKAGLVIAVYALRALAAVGFDARPIKCIFAGDEENLHLFSNARQVIAAEAAGALAAFNFETGDPEDRLIIGRSGGGPVRLTVHGVAAHSGIAPEQGRSAILEAAHKLIQLEQHNDFARGLLINCGRIEGGLGENTIPDLCTLRLGVRFADAAAQREVLALLEQVTRQSTVAGTWAELDTHAVTDCMETTPGVQRLFSHLQKTARACGYGALSSCRSGSLSDAGILVAAGVPTVCGMGACGAGSHSPQEYAEVASLFRRCYLAACAAAALPDDFAR